MSSETQAYALRDFHVVVAKRHVSATEGQGYHLMQLLWNVFPLWLCWLTQPLIHWAEVIYPGNVTIVDFQISHQEYLIPPSSIVLGGIVISPVVLPRLHPPIQASNPGSRLAQSSPTKSDRHSVSSLHNLCYLEINFLSIYSTRAEFWSFVDAVKPGVIYGCETWLKPNISQGEIFPPGYDVYRRDRKDGWGGVLLGIHGSLNSYQIDIETNAEFVAAKIVNGNQNIVVAVLYRSPVNNDNFMKELTSTISNLYQSNPGAAIWISGDANLPDIEWSIHSIRPSPRYKISLNEAFIDLLDRTGLSKWSIFPPQEIISSTLCWPIVLPWLTQVRSYLL